MFHGVTHVPWSCLNSSLPCHFIMSFLGKDISAQMTMINISFCDIIELIELN